MSFRHSLRGKTVVYGTILAALSVLLTITSCYFVSYKLIQNQFEYVNRITTSAAVERTNMYMGKIASTFNSAMNNDSFDILVGNRNTSFYSLIKAQKDYETYLKSLISLNDKVDALVLVSKKDIFVNIGNVVGQDFNEYKSDEFFDKVQGYIIKSDNSNQMYLDMYSRKNYERIAVINPVVKPGSMQLEAVVIAVLSKKLSENLQFTEGSIKLADGTGNYATIINKEDYKALDDHHYTFANKLSFSGWTIYNTYRFEKIQSLINHYYLTNIMYGLLYIFLSFLLLMWFSKLLVEPINQIEGQITNLNELIIENKPILFKKRKLGFKVSILILYTCLVTVPVMWFTASAYVNSKDIIENRLGSVFEYGVEILHQHIDFVLNSYYQKGVEIAEINSNVQTFLNNDISSDTKNKIQYVLNDFILANNFIGKRITNISLYDKSSNLICSSNYSWTSLIKTLNGKEFKFLTANGSKPLWEYFRDMNLNKDCIRIGIAVRGNGDDVEAGRFLGYMFIDFESSEITQMLDNFMKSNDVWVFLTSGSSQDLISNSEIAPQVNSLINYGIDLSRKQNKERVLFNMDRINYLMVVKQFDLNAFKLVYILRNFNEGRSILYVSIINLIVLIILSLIFSYGFSSMLSKNITKLIKALKSIKTGNLNARFKSSIVDEIGVLGNNFNEMLEQLNRMIDEKYISEVRLKDAEIRAREYELNLLQAQINPHFLYNTLKTAQYMVYMGDPRAEKMIKLLIALFKTGITRGEKLVSLKEEINHVKTYINIQQMRFSNKFDVFYNINKDLLNLKILKLTMQPLVENAIYHGLELKEGKGEIHIDADKHNDLLEFKISDNGIGMSSDKLYEIKELLEGKKQSKSIGVVNVHERIKLRFGNRYGLDIDSEDGKGTVVTARFPIAMEDSKFC